MFTAGFDAWLNEQVDVPEALVRAVDLSARGWRAQRGLVLEALAEAMSLDAHTLGQTAYELLDSLVWPVGEVLTGAVEARAAVRRVVDGLGVAEVIDALVDLGWGDAQLRQETPVGRVEMVLDDLLVLRLTQRVADAVESWKRRRRSR